MGARTEAGRGAEAGWPTPHELRAFLLLAEELHFGRAAARLGMAQSSLSELIRRLEATLGAVLLERSTRRVALTAAGRRMLPAARSVLTSLDAVRSAAGGPRREAGAVRVGVEASGLAELDGEVLAALAAQVPDGGIVVREYLGPDRAFADQSLDIAIVRSPAGRSLVVHEVATEPRGLLLPRDHPVARRGHGGLRDVMDEPFVAVAPGSPATRDYWLAVAQRGGRAPVVGGTAHTMREVVDAVGHLGLVTTACASMARAAPLPATAFVPADDLPPNPIGVAVLRGEARPEVLGLVEVVRRTVRELAGTAPGITPVR